jgi:hypothetical protein
MTLRLMTDHGPCAFGMRIVESHIVLYRIFRKSYLCKGFELDLPPSSLPEGSGSLMDFSQVLLDNN